jgi:predicted small lipoprotein YifL
VLYFSDMNKIKNSIFITISTVLLAGCGQAGNLYLPDNLQADKLEQQALYADVNKADELRAEAAQRRQRHQEMVELHGSLKGLEQQLAQRVAELGPDAGSDEILLRNSDKIAGDLIKEINRKRFRIGELTLQQQLANQ